MSITGLLVLANELYNLSDMKHTLFIFHGKNKRNIKVLEIDNDGYWLYQKKLSFGTITFPKEIEMITKNELILFLNGLSITEYRLHTKSNLKILY